jgi:hypothetical protein
MVAVGPEIHWSKQWKTLPDFLMDYFKIVFGKEWGEGQLAQPRDQWHPLFVWYVMICEYQQRVITTNQGIPQSYEATGASTGIMWLTYGLYLLRHNVEIQERLLQRLRSADPVQIFGAFHEVMVAAAMIRAGFALELENEADGSQTHCEFTATSKFTGKRFSVEVKVCDPGGSSNRSARSRTFRQLSRALSKSANYSRIICIDLNRPISADTAREQLTGLLRTEMRKIRSQEHTFTVHGQPAPPAYVVLWNYPFRYDLEGTHIPRGVLLEGFKISRLSDDAAFTSIRELSEFNALHVDPARFARELAQMQIPSTLDGDLPSRAFQRESDKLPPLLIGERYAVPNADGREEPGELVSAVVMEEERSVTGIVRTDSGEHSIIRIPISETELAIYKESPDTFFGVLDSSNIRAESPVEFYEAILSVYKDTPKEKLIEFLEGHPALESLRSLPQEELAKIYAEGIAIDFARRTQSDESKKISRRDPERRADPETMIAPWARR